MSIYESRLLLVYCVAVAALLGAVFGSFLNCMAWRLAHDESVWRGRSRCPRCGHTLGASELIPVVSWLVQRGRCRACGERISVRYPLTELAFAAVTVLCLLRFDLTVLCLRDWIFFCCLFVLSLTDLEVYEIPDGCLITAAAAWLLTLPFLWQGWGEAAAHIVTAVLLGGGLLGLSLALDRILKKETLGGGDIKLFAVVGLYTGPVGALLALITACVLGLLFLLLRRGRRDMASEAPTPGAIPFGPAIAAAAALVLLFGGGAIDWYMGLLGL